MRLIKETPVPFGGVLVWVGMAFGSMDDVEAASGNWLPANASCRNELNKSCAEPQELLMYTGAVMRHNKTDSHNTLRFSQGQLCIVRSPPQNDGNVVQPSAQQEERIRITLIAVRQRIMTTENIPDS